MAQMATLRKTAEAAHQWLPCPAPAVTVTALRESQTEEVIAFLNQRPIHTVAMLGFILDNGIVSPLNRGTFYSCRNRSGELEGVALIGHATLLETRTDRATEAFADVARDSNAGHMIMGERERIEEFWSYYAEGGQELRLACRELLFELKWPVEAREQVSGLRLAKLEDIDLVMPIQAEMAFAESGVNPLETDPEGFRKRCERRIQQGRTWVLVERGILRFKAEVISDTPEITYLEGVWVNPNERGKGYGLRCMSQLARTLLSRTRSLCLLVNQKNTDVHRFYKRAGYKLRSVYDTIFLAQ